MTTMQATSFAYQTSCTICQAVSKAFSTMYQSVLLGRQLQANFRVAESLQRMPEYRGQSVAQIANALNQRTI